MLDIPIGQKGDEYITVSSGAIDAVVFPCSNFESSILLSHLIDRHGFVESDLIQSRFSKSFLVGEVEYKGEKQPINVTLWCWQVGSVWLCFVESVGDFFSYNIVDDWLREHFPCRWNQGRQQAIFDPMNFRNCVSAIKEAIAKRGEVK